MPVVVRNIAAVFASTPPTESPRRVPRPSILQSFLVNLRMLTERSNKRDRLPWSRQPISHPAPKPVNVVVDALYPAIVAADTGGQVLRPPGDGFEPRRHSAIAAEGEHRGRGFGGDRDDPDIPRRQRRGRLQSREIMIERPQVLGDAFRQQYSIRFSRHDSS